MKTHSCFRLLTTALTGAILFTTTALQAEAADHVKVTDLMTKDLVSVPGKEVTMITVDYPPGGADPVHRQNASAFVYVLEGSIVMQMKGGEKVTLFPSGGHVLRRPGRHSPSREKCERHETREIPRLSGQGQRRTTSHSCEQVTPCPGDCGRFESEIDAKMKKREQVGLIKGKVRSSMV